MSSSGGLRAVLALMLVAAFATLACTTSLSSGPDPTRKPPRTAAPKVSASPATASFPVASASRAPTVPASAIPIVRALAYRGVGSVDGSSVRLREGVYRASWAITGNDGTCTFRAELTQIGDRSSELTSVGQAPHGATVEGWDHIRVTGGPYDLRVTAPSCRWKLDVVPIAGLD